MQMMQGSTIKKSFIETLVYICLEFPTVEETVHRKSAALKILNDPAAPFRTLCPSGLDHKDKIENDIIRIIKWAKNATRVFTASNFLSGEYRPINQRENALKKTKFAIYKELLTFNTYINLRRKLNGMF